MIKMEEVKKALMKLQLMKDYLIIWNEKTSNRWF